MSKILAKIIFLIFFLTNLNAEIVNTLSVKGNNRIPTETIKVYGDIVIGKSFSEADINKILNNLYATEFFEDVKVSLINNELRIVVKEYPFVNDLIILGENSKKYIDKITKIINTKKKRSFVKSYLVKDVENIKYLYSSIGYNSAKVEIKTKEYSDDQVDVLIEIDRGNKQK